LGCRAGGYNNFADGVSTVEIVVSVGRGERLARVMLAITAIAPLAGSPFNGLYRCRCRRKRSFLAGFQAFFCIL
jgi:hypothetical protein